MKQSLKSAHSVEQVDENLVYTGKLPTMGLRKNTPRHTTVGDTIVIYECNAITHRNNFSVKVPTSRGHQHYTKTREEHHQLASHNSVQIQDAFTLLNKSYSSLDAFNKKHHKLQNHNTKNVLCQCWPNQQPASRYGCNVHYLPLISLLSNTACVSSWGTFESPLCRHNTSINDNYPQYKPDCVCLISLLWPLALLRSWACSYVWKMVVQSKRAQGWTQRGARGISSDARNTDTSAQFMISKNNCACLHANIDDRPECTGFGRGQSETEL